MSKQEKVAVKRLSTLEADTIIYERQLEQKKSADAIHELLKIREAWTLEDVNKAVTVAKQGTLCGLDDPRVALGELDGPDLMKEILGAIDEYQRSEAKRRVLEKASKKKEATDRRMAKRLELVKGLKENRRLLVKLETTKFTEAIERVDLNTELITEGAVAEAVKSANEATAEATQAERDLPTIESAYTDIVHNNFISLVAKQGAKVQLAQKAINAEMTRRRDIEKEAYLAQQAILNAEKEKLQAVEDVKNAELKRIRDNASAAQEERMKYQAELTNILSDKKALMKAEEEMENAIESIMETVSDRQEAEKAIHLLKNEHLRKVEEQKKKEIEMKEKEAQVAKALVEEKERQRIRDEENRIEQLKLAQIQNAKNKQQELKVQEEEERKQKEKEKQDKADAMNKERSLIEAGEDDTEEEKQMREEAKSMISQYKGDVFQSVKDNNFQMTRAFLIVNGLKMLSSHSKGELDGGRTIVHAAAWYGCPKLLDYLARLGADMNQIDTAALRTTPLMEAARAGRVDCIDILLANGAKLTAQDAAGDTAAHIAARASRGGVIITMINAAETHAPKSSYGFLDIKNHKKRTAYDVAPNDQVKKIIEIAIEKEKKRKELHSRTANRMKKGIVKAKVLGNQAGESALTKIKAKQKRYARS